MTVRVPSKTPNGRSEVWSVDFREKAPALAHNDMYKEGTNSSRYGGLAVGVPGELRGFEEAHRRWGSLSWKELFLPSVELAKRFQVGAELGKRIPVSTSGPRFVEENSYSATSVVRRANIG